MNRKKLISVTHYSTLYGANKSLLSLIEGSTDHIDWIVFCRKMPVSQNGDIKEELTRLNVKCVSIPFRVDVFVPRKSFIQNVFFFTAELVANFMIAIFVAIYARLNGVNGIHSNSSASCLGAYIAKISGLPHIWHFREFLDMDYKYQYKFGFKYLTFWANQADRIIAISKSVFEESIVRRNIETKCEIIYNGIILQRDLLPYFKKIKKEVISLVIVGVLDQSKNQLDAVKATSLLHSRGLHIELNIFGSLEGVYFDELRRYVEDNNLNSVIKFQGYKSKQIDIFLNADITLVCSKNEGMGRVTIESMANSIPVVGYDAAGTSELIKNGHTGVLYRGGFLELASAISTIINDRILYESITKNAYEHVKARFLVESYVFNFLKANEILLR